MRRRWGTTAVWAFALSVAALALWVLAPEDVWRRTRSEEADLQSPRSDAPVSTAAGASGEHGRRSSSSAPPAKTPAVNFAVITIGGDGANGRRGHSKTLSGHVRFDDGIPVVGASVACDLVGAPAGTRKPFDQHTTNAAGYFALLVRPGETYSVRARCGKAWVSAEQRAEAGRRDLEFLVPRTRRLEVKLLDAEAGSPHPVRTMTARWPLDGEQAEWIGHPNTPFLVLPGAAEVDEGGEIVVAVFGAGRSYSGKTLRLARSELDRGPLMRTLRYEASLLGTWNLRIRVLHHDGTPFVGSGMLGFKPYKRARHGTLRDGVFTFTRLDRNFEEIYLELFVGARRRLALDRPADGDTVELSWTLPEPWTLTLSPRFESLPQPPVRVLPHVFRAADPDHRAGWQNRNWIKDAGWTGRFTGMGDGHWWVRILAIEDRAKRRTLWEQKVVLAGGDEVTLNPWIPAGKPAEEKD